MMIFQKLFPNKKAVIAMLHLKGTTPKDLQERAKQEISIFYRQGVDAVLVENYFGSTEDCRWVLAYLKEHYQNNIYGVNILGDMETAFALADMYKAKFIQIDSVCGHLRFHKDAAFAQKLNVLRSKSHALVFGGVRFKYQPVLSGRTVEEDLRLGITRCDAVVVTGAGTGLDTPREKIEQFRNTLGDFPLIAGAGVTAETVAQTLSVCDGIIVGSWLKEGHDIHGEVSEEYVRQFVAAAKK